MVNVVVGRKRNVAVSANATAGIIDTSVPVTLKNTPIGTGVTRLDQLSDVEASTEVNNGVLTYYAPQDKYIVKLISFEDISGDLDGGSF